MPAARGLFQRAILESGPANNVQEKEAASQIARQFLEILGLERNEIAALRDIPYKKLLAAQAQFISANGLGGMQPVLDGKSLRESPFQAISRGAVQEVALLVGTNRDEARLFTDEYQILVYPVILGRSSPLNSKLTGIPPTLI
jgi:para-nitrobenzyl esterase